MCERQPTHKHMSIDARHVIVLLSSVNVAPSQCQRVDVYVAPASVNQRTGCFALFLQPPADLSSISEKFIEYDDKLLLLEK